MIQFSIVFVLGLTIIPFICTLKALAGKIQAPDAPEKPTCPVKPDKPREPGIGATNEQWAEYRQAKANYREKKKKWKEDYTYYKANQSQINIAYDKRRRDYSKKMNEYKRTIEEPTKGEFCKTFQSTTGHAFFCGMMMPSLFADFLWRYNIPKPEQESD
jgi:hypothetical protein